MVGLWLVGQGPSVMPGGVGVLYAPPGMDVKPGERVADCPWSVDALRLDGLAADNAVMQAGVALIGELQYGADGLEGFVARLWSAVNLPGPVAAVGDESESMGASVNRGPASIGLSDRMQFVDRFDAQGVLGRARVVGFVERGGEIVPACDEVAVASFPLMFAGLVDYLRFQVAAQVAGNGYDDLAGALAKSDRPTHAVVVAGLATLTAGALSLLPGDVCHTVVYDSDAVPASAIHQALRDGDADGVLQRDGVSWLRQVVG